LSRWWKGQSAKSATAEPPEREARAQRERPSDRVARASLGEADALLVIEVQDLFSQRGAEAYRAVVDRIGALDVIASVRSMDEAPPLNIFGLPEPVLPRGHATPQRFAHAKKKATEHPMVVGLYLSADAQTALIELQYDWIHIRGEEDCTNRVLEAAKVALVDFPDVKMDFSITGYVPLQLEFRKNNESNELKYQLIGYGMILLMAIILFRGMAVVVVVAAAPILGVFWTLGFLRYFNWQDNPFSFVILPVLLALVGFTDGVHMMVHIRTCIQQGLLPKDACRRTLRWVGLACFLTSLTTAIGMGSLTLAHHRIVREFGWSCVIGVTATWISVMLVIPLASNTVLGRWFSKGRQRDYLDRYLDFLGPCVTWFVRHARRVSIIAILLTLGLAAFALTLRPDDRKSSALPAGGNSQRALARVDEAMGGLDICSIGIHWSEPRTDAQVVEVISRIDQILADEPLLGHRLSLSRLLEAMPGEGSALEKVAMAELLPPPLKLALYSPENQHARIVFRCKDLGTAAYQETFQRVETALENMRNDCQGFQFDMTGDAIWRWRNLYKIVTDLATSLGTAAVVIFGVLAVAFRSLRLGLISIIPNLLPLLATAAWLSATGQPLEIVSVCCFTICLGIAVDDTIHFLSRYQLDRTLTPDRHLAVQRAVRGVGTGMVMTTIVLVAGFSSVLFSETRDHRVFGSLGVITLISALLCDLFLLPALLIQFDGSSQNSDTR
jgi:hypothetical protein